MHFCYRLGPMDPTFLVNTALKSIPSYTAAVCTTLCVRNHDPPIITFIEFQQVCKIYLLYMEPSSKILPSSSAVIHSTKQIAIQES